MMTKRKWEYFGLAIYLVCITGVSTHALLMVHLSCCHIEKSDAHPHEQDEPSRPTHDHTHCLFCQSFLGIGGTFLSPPADMSFVDDTAVAFHELYSHSFYLQPVLTAAMPRGPPCA